MSVTSVSIFSPVTTHHLKKKKSMKNITFVLRGGKCSGVLGSKAWKWEVERNCTFIIPGVGGTVASFKNGFENKSELKL